MATQKDATPSEELILYLDLTTDYVDKESLLKIIDTFITNKVQYSPDSSFGIVIFQEEDNPITLYDNKDSNSIIQLIEDKWETRPKNHSYIENGLFEILSYIFRKSREIKKIFRVIIISDTPSKRSDEYHQAVYDLIIKSKKFSTFIDIIRVGEAEYYDDDVKIKVITSETHGGTFYCNINQFSNVLASLIKNKQEFNIIKTEEAQILEEDKMFYERLAVDLISLDKDDDEICSICQFELCPVCGAYSDEIRKCYNCSAKFHGCCIAHYSISNNIGFKHIFRCPQCQNLLKIDEDYVNLISEEEFEEKGIKIEEIKEKQIIEGKYTEEKISEEILVEEKKIEEEIEESEVESKEFIEEVVEYKENHIEEEQEPVEDVYEQKKPIEDKVGQSLSELKINLEQIPPPPPLKKIKIGGFFGREVEVGHELKEKPKKRIKILEPQYVEEKKSITELKPPKKRASFKFCKICGFSAKNTVICPNCGANID